jgi:hypothetical protein
MCPKGDDPFTISSDYRSITIVTSATSGTLAGSFKFSFGDSYIYFPADATFWDSDDCTEALQAMSNIDVAECTRGAPTARKGATYNIRLLEFPMFPVDNNIFFNDGNPPLNYFKCETYKVTSGTSPTCTISDVAVTSIPGKFKS